MDNDFIIPGYIGRIQIYNSRSITYDALYYVLKNISQIPRCKWFILHPRYIYPDGHNGKIIACRSCLNIFKIIDGYQDINDFNFSCDCVAHAK